MNKRSDDRGVSERARALQALRDASPAVLLSLEDDEAVVAMILGPSSTNITVHRLAFDAQPKGNFPSLSDPPTPLQLERAIEQIEDFAMPLASRIRPGFVLFLNAGSCLWLPPTRAGTDMTVDRRSIDEVELAFQHLAAIAEGRSTSPGDVPTDAAAARSLLVAREAMHHLGFDAVESLST